MAKQPISSLILILRLNLAIFCVLSSCYIKIQKQKTKQKLQLATIAVHFVIKKNEQRNIFGSYLYIECSFPPLFHIDVIDTKSLLQNHLK